MLSRSRQRRIISARRSGFASAISSAQARNSRECGRRPRAIPEGVVAVGMGVHPRADAARSRNRQPVGIQHLARVREIEAEIVDQQRFALVGDEAGSTPSSSESTVIIRESG